MRRFISVSLACALGFTVTSIVRAQTAPQASASSSSLSTADAQSKPPATAQTTQTTTPDLSSRSLFEQTWNQFQFGGRLSSIDGDPARWQRYQDLRDGVLFTDARYSREDPAGSWLFRGTADNVGYRDQRYSALYEHPGRFSVSGLWDQIPQFYSVDTQTPYTTTVSPLL